MDGVGADRYAVAARLNLGADIDLKEAYEWGWAELQRIEAELAAEADAISPGAGVAEATAILNESAYVTGTTPTWPGSRTGTTGPSSSSTACTSTSPPRCAGSRWSSPRLHLGGRLLHRAQRRPVQARTYLVAAGRPGPPGAIPDLGRAVHGLPRGRPRSPPAGRRGQDRRRSAVAVRENQLRERPRRRLGPVRRAPRR